MSEVNDTRTSWGTLSLHTGDDLAIRCHSYTDSKPILDVTSGAVSVTLTCRDSRGEVTSDDLRFARNLVKAAGEYVAALERLRRRHAAADHDTGAA